MTDERHSFGTGMLMATVTAKGAELVALHDVMAGRDLLWGAGAAWPRHSPVLFPIVGRLPGDAAVLDGRPVHVTQHGFARDREFRWVSRDAEGCVLELCDDAETRAAFPQAFRLRLAYRIEGGRLTVSYTLHNPDGSAVLHASLGAHPAFAWPLREGVAKTEHRLVFARDEPAAIRRIEGGLLLPEGFATPVEGRVLALDESLFVADAIIMEAPESRSVDYVTPAGDGLRVAWGGFRELGLWMKPGAAFLCIEPWHGYATPVGFAGDFAGKPGLLHLEPGQDWGAFWSVEMIDAI